MAEAESPGAPGAGRAAVDRRDVEDWLGPRLEDVPPRLAAAVRGCVDRAEPDDARGGVSGWLALAALEQFGRVEAERTGDRGEALRLLAADASLTFAFEAAAEEDVDLARMAEDWGPSGRLGRQLAERRRGRT